MREDAFVAFCLFCPEVLPQGFVFERGIKMVESKKVNIKKISVVAMLCALAFLCTVVFKFKVSFLTFDIKDAILAISSLLYGPIAGVLSSLVVAFLEMVTVSDTGFYGMIMNFLSSGTFTFICGVIYKYKRNMTGAIIGVVAAALSVTAVMLLANLFVTPYYMGVQRGVVIGMLGTLLLPFNLTKAVLNAAVTLLIYKPFTVAMRKARLLPERPNSNYKFGLKSVILIVSAVIVIVFALLFFVLYLNGSFEFFG